MLIGADLLVDYPPAYSTSTSTRSEFGLSINKRRWDTSSKLRVTEEEEAEVGPPVNEYAFFSIVAATTVVFCTGF